MRPLTISKPELQRRSCCCRCHCRCRCRCLIYQIGFWCFDCNFISNAIDAVGRGRGRRRRRLRLRHRRRREHPLFCSRLTSVECTNQCILSFLRMRANWSIQESIIYICTWVEPPTSHALGTEVACEKTAWGVGGARGRRESRGALGKLPGSTGDCALEKW